MAKKSRGVVLLVLGVLIVIVCLGADALGLGSNPGMGWKQLAGSAVGAIVGLAGVVGLLGGRAEE